MDPLQISLIQMSGVTIDVDLSFPIQIGIMLVLMVVLKQLIFDPYLKSVESRDAKTDAARQDAQRIKARAEALSARYQEGIAAAKTQALADRQELRVSGLQHRERQVGDARTASTALIDETHQSVEEAWQAAHAELDRHAQEISRQVVEKVLGRGV